MEIFYNMEHHFYQLKITYLSSKLKIIGLMTINTQIMTIYIKDSLSET